MTDKMSDYIPDSNDRDSVLETTKNLEHTRLETPMNNKKEKDEKKKNDKNEDLKKLKRKK